MLRTLMISMAVFAGVALPILLLRPATAHSAEAQATEPTLKRRFLISGNASFDTADIRRALLVDYEVIEAFACKVPADAVAEVVKRRLVSGYRHRGFPDVEIDVDAGEPAAARRRPDELRRTGKTPSAGAGEPIAVGIREGKRYRPGELRFRGTTNVPTQRVAGLLTPGKQPDHGANPASHLFPWKALQEENADLRRWFDGEWAAVDEDSIAAIEKRVRQAFVAVGYPYAKFQLIPVFNDCTTRSDLVVHVLDDGGPALVNQLLILGNRRNSAYSIRGLLDWMPGMLFDAEAHARMSSSLDESGRFCSHEFNLRQPESAGDGLTLELQLTESTMTPLGEPTVCHETALLQACRWMSRYDDEGYDLVVDAAPYRLIFSREGVVISLEHADESPIHLAAVIEATKTSLYQVHDRRKLTTPALPVCATLKLFHVSPPEPTTRAKLSGTGTIRLRRADDPIAALKIDLPAAALLQQLEDCDWRCDGSEVQGSITGADGSELSITVDLDSGRFSAVSRIADHERFRVRFEKNALREAAQKFELELADVEDEFDPDRPISAVSTFVTGIFTCISPEILQQAGAITDFLYLTLREAGLLDPERHLSSDRYFIPPRDETCDKLAESFDDDRQSWIAWMATGPVNELFPPESWAWTAVSSMTAGYIDHPVYDEWTRELFKHFCLEQTDGPLSSSVAIRFLGGHPERTRYVAGRGLSRMTEDAFRRDCGPLLDRQGAIGFWAAEAATVWAAKEPEELDRMLEGVPDPVSRFVQTTADALRSTDGLTAAEALEEALDDLWKNSLRSAIEANLRSKLGK